MPVQRKYDDEMRARAVRLYVERRKSDPAESQVASRRHVGGLIGVGPETLRGWVERDERNAGARPGLSDEASAEVRQLRKENAGRGRANEILRTASAYVGDRCQVPVSSSRSRSPWKTASRAVWPLASASSRCRWSVGLKSMVVWKKVQPSQMMS